MNDYNYLLSGFKVNYTGLDGVSYSALYNDGNLLIYKGKRRVKRYSMNNIELENFASNLRTKFIRTPQGTLKGVQL